MTHAQTQTQTIVTHSRKSFIR